MISPLPLAPGPVRSAVRRPRARSRGKVQGRGLARHQGCFAMRFSKRVKNQTGAGPSSALVPVFGCGHGAIGRALLGRLALAVAATIVVLGRISGGRTLSNELLDFAAAFADQGNRDPVGFPCRRPNVRAGSTADAGPREQADALTAADGQQRIGDVQSGHHPRAERLDGLRARRGHVAAARDLKRLRISARGASESGRDNRSARPASGHQYRHDPDERQRPGRQSARRRSSCTSALSRHRPSPS